MDKIIQLYCFIKSCVHHIVNDAYHGNTFALKFEPLYGTFLSLSAMGFIDAHWNIAKFVGSIILTGITITMGVFGPILLRYWAHGLGRRYAWIARIMKHDKKGNE